MLLGDSHNFGRQVEMRQRRIFKPRPLLWEWLLLSGRSPLRRFLEAEGSDALGPHPFGFLPRLNFYSPRRLHREGEVERLKLAPLPSLDAKERRELAGLVGRAVALWSWLGLSDLHWENLALGIDARSQLIFAPLDIESILSDLTLPTQTKLLPDSDPDYAAICRHACGLRRVLPYLGKPVGPTELLAMADDYRLTLLFLQQRAQAIGRLIASAPRMRETPIRVCLRGTADYVLADQGRVRAPFLAAELEQLARGDIPYFFRLYGRAGLYYYRNRARTQFSRVDLGRGAMKANPLLQLSRMRSPGRRSLAEQGLFVLLAAFDSEELSGHHREGKVEIIWTKRQITVQLSDGLALQARRDLSSFVESIYLDCTCGEVRQPFVPKVTSCRSGGN